MRYRLTFTKEYPVKYVGHMDVVLTWTRAFRRAGVPLAYSEGFNPRAKIQVAASLPVGTMGSAEMMDITLTEPMEPDDILQRVNATLPNGYRLLAVEAIAADTPKLQASLRQAEYRVTVETDLSAEEIQSRIEHLLAQPQIIQTRIRRKREETFDLRPLVFDISLVEKVGDDVVLAMRLATGQHGNARPDAVLYALGMHNKWYQSERTKLIFDI